MEGIVTGAFVVGGGVVTVLSGGTGVVFPVETVGVTLEGAVVAIIFPAPVGVIFAPFMEPVVGVMGPPVVPPAFVGDTPMRGFVMEGAGPVGVTLNIIVDCDCPLSTGVGESDDTAPVGLGETEGDNSGVPLGETAGV